MSSKAYEQIVFNILNTLEYGACNIGGYENTKKLEQKVIKIGDKEPKKMFSIIDEGRVEADALAEKTFEAGFAPDLHTAKLYAYARMGRVCRMGNCDVHSALAVTGILATGRDCIYASAQTMAMKDSRFNIGHVFAIVPAEGQTIRSGDKIKDLGGAVIIDTWIHMYLCSLDKQAKNNKKMSRPAICDFIKLLGVYPPAIYADLVSNKAIDDGYFPTLRICRYYKSEIVKHIIEPETATPLSVHIPAKPLSVHIPGPRYRYHKKRHINNKNPGRSQFSRSRHMEEFWC